MTMDYSSGYEKVERYWGQGNVAANQNAVEMPCGYPTRATNGASQVVRHTANHDGSLVGLIADLNAAAGAGTCKIEFTINGVVVAASALTVNTSAAARKSFQGEKLGRFKAGDKLGLKITTSGAWNGTTSDLLATAELQYEKWKP